MRLYRGNSCSNQMDGEGVLRVGIAAAKETVRRPTEWLANSTVMIMTLRDPMTKNTDEAPSNIVPFEALLVDELGEWNSGWQIKGQSDRLLFEIIEGGIVDVVDSLLGRAIDRKSSMSLSNLGVGIEGARRLGEWVNEVLNIRFDPNPSIANLTINQLTYRVVRDFRNSRSGLEASIDFHRHPIGDEKWTRAGIMPCKTAHFSLALRFC